MIEYPKIVTVWNRDPATKFKTLVEREFALPEFEYLQDSPWRFTEKIDGTNIRVIWDGSSISFRGRTNRAEIPSFLLETLNRMFTSEGYDRFYDAFDIDANSEQFVCLYGEGYGKGIQKVGKSYKSDGTDFVLFDVMINGVWLDWDDVEDAAFKLEIPVVPRVAYGTLHDAIDLARDGFNSGKGDFMAEGLVMRPLVELQTKMGKRIITKVKCRDFPPKDGSFKRFPVVTYGR